MVELTVSVAVPDAPVIEVGNMVALRPEDGDVESVTVPENPPVGEMVIVEVPLTLVLMGPIAVGFAASVKSGFAITSSFPTIAPGEW